MELSHKQRNSQFFARYNCPRILYKQFLIFGSVGFYWFPSAILNSEFLCAKRSIELPDTNLCFFIFILPLLFRRQTCQRRHHRSSQLVLYQALPLWILENHLNKFFKKQVLFTLRIHLNDDL